jgi:hypothetical protein
VIVNRGTGGVSDFLKRNRYEALRAAGGLDPVHFLVLTEHQLSTRSGIKQYAVAVPLNLCTISSQPDYFS